MLKASGSVKCVGLLTTSCLFKENAGLGLRSQRASRHSLLVSLPSLSDRPSRAQQPASLSLASPACNRNYSCTAVACRVLRLPNKSTRSPVLAAPPLPRPRAPPPLASSHRLLHPSLRRDGPSIPAVPGPDQGQCAVQVQRTPRHL